MSVITVQKEFQEIHGMLFQRGDLQVVVLGCDKCAKVSRTGGAQEVREMKERLSGARFMLLTPGNLVDAVEEGMCDTEAVAKRTAPLREHQGRFQILVMSCGAGLKCVRDLLPCVRIVPGLNTLGPGVKDQLACLSCGDCRFGEDGCRMAVVSKSQAERLNRGYPVPVSGA